MTFTQRFGLVVALAAGTATIFLASASALPPVGPIATQAKERPVVGELYAGLRIDGRGYPVDHVLCDASIAGKRLRAHLTRTAKGATCAWRIPAGTAGKKLLPWRYSFGRHYRITWGAGYVQGQFAWVVK
jgi:hypothetical protein